MLCCELLSLASFSTRICGLNVPPIVCDYSLPNRTKGRLMNKEVGTFTPLQEKGTNKIKMEKLPLR